MRKGDLGEGSERKIHTFKNDTKRALANLFPNTEVVTDYASCSCRLRRMGRGRGYYMWGCHRGEEREGKGERVG